MSVFSELKFSESNKFAVICVLQLLILSSGFFFLTAVAAKDVIYDMATVENDKAAQYFLGRRYLTGTGVIQDNSQAARWFVKAADQGHIKAAYHLGLLYKDGIDIGKNIQSAFDNFLKAAQREHIAAMYELGNYYSLGLDGPVDIEQALIWYQMAAARKHDDAKIQLAKIVEIKNKNDTIEQLNQKKLMPPPPVKVVQIITIESSNIDSTSPIINESQPKQDYDFDTEIIGYLNDFPTGPDIVKPELQFRVGILYLKGKGLSKSIFTAMSWLEKSANNNYPEAQYLLGIMYKEGSIINKNKILAHKWLNRALKNGYADAKVALNK